MDNQIFQLEYGFFQMDKQQTRFLLKLMLKYLRFLLFAKIKIIMSNIKRFFE
jgi:hypothetical protein